MGSPVSVVIANLVMEDVEERAMHGHVSFPPHFWKRYLDDTCTALPRDMVVSFHNHLNCIDLCSQFTVTGGCQCLVILRRGENGAREADWRLRKRMVTSPPSFIQKH